MPLSRTTRAALLVLTTLSACAASDGGWDESPGRSSFKPTGAFGAFLAGRFAAQQSDFATAAEKLEEAAKDSGAGDETRDVSTQAFIAAVLAGRPEVSRLAATLPGNPVAQLVLADEDVKARRWSDAEARFAGLPQEGITQVLRPLLVAWAQAGAGRTDQALATLQPLIDSSRLRAVAALHAAAIADLADRKEDAARLYALARSSFGGINLRLGLMLASWEARNGHPDTARRIVDEMTSGNGELTMVRAGLESGIGNRVISGPADGIAELYLAVGASIQGREAQTSQVLLQLAVALRPDFTAARLLVSDALAAAKRFGPALQALAPVNSDDPMIPAVRLRQAALQSAMGQRPEAVATLDRLAAAFPDRPEPLAQAGDVLRAEGKFAEAVGSYDRAIARLGTPRSSAWPLFYARGIANERSGNWPRAESDFLYALQLSPDQASVLNYLGYAWTERDQNLPRAREMIQRAVQLRPEEGSFIDSLGWVQLRQGDNNAALKSLERAVELESEDAVVNGHLGDALAAAGRLREAEFQWRRALTLKPDAAEQKRIESRLATLPVNVPGTGPAAAPGTPPRPAP